MSKTDPVTVGPSEGLTDETSPARKRALSKPTVERYAVPVLLLVLLASFSATVPTFRTLSNFEGMINSQSIVLMLALTAAITLRAGAFDLSIAQVMAASSATVAMLTVKGTPLAVAIVAALALGVAVGLVHGFLIVIVGVDSFITTLGTLTALTGVTYAITGGQIVAGLPATLTTTVRSEFLGLPVGTWCAWGGVVVVWFVFERTALGRHLLFIGGNEAAARLAGLPVTRLRYGTFVASSTLAALTGVVLVGQLGAVDPNMGSMYLLPPFAAVFLGSTAFTPGRFNALGTMIAVYLLIAGITGLQLIGVSDWVSSVFNGLALVIAVTLARLANRQTR